MPIPASARPQPSPSTASVAPRALRLLSIDARAAGRDRGALAALIESYRPDVACVHHGPSLLRWRSISAALGRRSGLVVVTGGRTAGASLILSTLGVDALASTDVLFGRRTELHPAGAALALLRSGGRELVVATAELTGAADQTDLERAAAGLAPGTPPLVVCFESGTPAAAGRVAVTDSVHVDSRIAVNSTDAAGAGTLVELVLP